MAHLIPDIDLIVESYIVRQLYRKILPKLMESDQEIDQLQQSFCDSILDELQMVNSKLDLNMTYETLYSWSKLLQASING